MVDFKKAADKLKNKRDDARKKLQAKMSKLISNLAALTKEFQELRKEMEAQPGTIYYEHAHPEEFFQKPRSRY